MKTIEDIKTFISNNKYRFYYGFVRLVVRAGFRVKVVKVSPYENRVIKPKHFKKEFKTDKGVLLVANHTHRIDPGFIMYPYSKNKNKITVPAKVSLFKNKTLGNFLKTCGGIPVIKKADELTEKDTSSFNSQGTRQIIRTFKNKDIVLIFPEGTRNKDGKVTDDCKSIKRLSKTKDKDKELIDVIPINIQYHRDKFRIRTRVMVYIKETDPDDRDITIENIKNVINELPEQYEGNKTLVK